MEKDFVKSVGTLERLDNNMITDMTHGHELFIFHEITIPIAQYNSHIMEPNKLSMPHSFRLAIRSSHCHQYDMSLNVCFQP